MSREKLNVALHLSLLIVVTAMPAWCQSAELKGTITDMGSNKPLPAVSITVYMDETGAFHKVVYAISGADGHYSVTNLRRNSSVRVSYSCGGYFPHPKGPDTITLLRKINTTDIQLIHDADDSGYWSTWANNVKTNIDSSTKDQDTRDTLYIKSWSDLGQYGFSTVAQVQAARQLKAIAPQSMHSADLINFAMVDVQALKLADANIRSAANGQSRLSQSYNIPPTIAAMIAADALKSQDVPEPQRTEFIKEFGATWGDTGKADLAINLHDLSPEGGGGAHVASDPGPH